MKTIMKTVRGHEMYEDSLKQKVEDLRVKLNAKFTLINNYKDKKFDFSVSFFHKLSENELDYVGKNFYGYNLIHGLEINTLEVIV